MLIPNDMQSLFDSIGQEIIVNDVPVNAVITNPSISEFEERYIHSIQNVSRGSLVDLEGNKYLSITESNIKRGGKFKSLVRHCNYVIKIKGETHEELLLDRNGDIIYDDFGEPITTTVQGDPTNVSCVVENKTFAISGTQLLVADNEIIVMVQDNTFNTVKFVTNKIFELMGYNWKIRDDDRTKKGLLILTCEFTTSLATM